MKYLILIDNPRTEDELPTRVRVVGPFSGARAAHHWASSKPSNHLAWQLVELDDPKIPVSYPTEEEP